MKKWLCIICGWIYDEAKGWPADGIAAGTRWEDIPNDWLCPDCGVAKADFEMLEISPSENAQSIAQIAEPEAPVVIIGSGYAGYHLAQELRQRNNDKPIVIFTSDDGANYSKPGLSNAFSRDKTALDLISEPLLAVEQRLNVRIHAYCKVKSIDAKQHTIETDLGQQAYSKLIFATGGAPIKLPIAGDGAQDVLSINDLQDYKRFRARLSNLEVTDSNQKSRRDKHIAIIGNGLIGCEFANDLTSQGYKVSVIGLTKWPMDRLIPQSIGDELIEKLASQGVQWHLQNSIEQINKLSSGYQLQLADSTLIQADLVLSAVGLTPRRQLAIDAGIHCNRGIVVNGGLRTNLADIYALGDCAEIKGQLLPFIAPITHSASALADCILGRPTMAIYPLMPVIVKTPALPLTVLSAPINATGEWQTQQTATGQRAFFKDSSGNLLGFVLSGGTTNERQHWLEKINQ